MASLIPSGPVFAQRASKARVKVALLAPLTGPAAAIGLSMQRAALLAQAPGAKADELIVIDTAGGAAAAATLAAKRGARIIIGPLYAADTRAVVGAVDPAIPVLSLSNDESLAGSGAFLLGITATQSVTAILRYARSRGVRRVAVLDGASSWAVRGMAAAGSLGRGLGLDIVSVAADAPDLPAALRRAGRGELPDALLVAEAGDALAAAARAVAGSNLQLLGSQQSLDRPVPGADGAWVAGPDPRQMSEFADRYQVRSGGIPGSIAALAFDAANIAELLRRGPVDRGILLGGTAFPAITGPIRFLADGTATRELAILVAGPDGFTATDRA